jgi:guanylate kinase
MLRHSFTETRPDLSAGGVICLVGRTGSGKNEVAKCLVQSHGMVKPVTSTTRPPRAGEGACDYHFLTEKEFLAENAAGKYLETTVYSGHHFGTCAEAIDRIVDAGGVAVLPIDICGALSLKNRYRSRAMLVFLKRRREDVIFDIVKRDMDVRDKTCRILSLDNEYRNEELCDLCVDANRMPSEIADTITAALARNGG